MIMRTCSGVALYTRLSTMALMPTDLPEPVVPAISRCGMRARSATTGTPPMSLPSASASGEVDLVVGLGFDDLAERDDLALLVRDLQADHRFAGNDLHHAHADGGQRARQILGTDC